MLAPMQFKTFLWPHNPKVYQVNYKRKLITQSVPFGRDVVQDLGLSTRVLLGEGEFVGRFAYANFRHLASLFYQDTPGKLIHPIWQGTQAYFASLSLKQEPKQNYVHYQFAFWEHTPPVPLPTVAEDSQMSPRQMPAPTQTLQSHIVQKGDTLWGIARRYGTSLEALLAQNPDIANPNLIYIGQKVMLPC